MKLSNAMSVLDKSGQIAARLTQKRHLLAFGEYLPRLGLVSEDERVGFPEISDFGAAAVRRSSL